MMSLKKLQVVSIFFCLFFLYNTSTVVAEEKSTNFPDLSNVKSRVDFNFIIASISDDILKKALLDNADLILAAIEQYQHVKAVMRTIDSFPGSYQKVNTTPESLQKLKGGDMTIFDSLSEVSTRIFKGRDHQKRKLENDPYNFDFMEHLGYISTLKSVKIVALGIQDSWMKPLLKLKKLEFLSIEGAGRLGDASLLQLKQLESFPNLTRLELAYFKKASDEGLEQLAGLKNLEYFAFRGNLVRGHAFEKFKGWTKLKNINFHSNSLDDEGMGYVCDNFINLEHIKLWHSKLMTDESASHFSKLKNLKGIEISGTKVTAALLKNMNQLPMEFMALGYGVNAPVNDIITTIKTIPTLRRLSMEATMFSHQDLSQLSESTQIESLSINSMPLTDKYISGLKSFMHVDELKLIERRKEYYYSDELKTKVLRELGNRSVTFIP